MRISPREYIPSKQASIVSWRNQHIHPAFLRPDLPPAAGHYGEKQTQKMPIPQVQTRARLSPTLPRYILSRRAPARVYLPYLAHIHIACGDIRIIIQYAEKWVIIITHTDRCFGYRQVIYHSDNLEAFHLDLVPPCVYLDTFGSRVFLPPPPSPLLYTCLAVWHPATYSAYLPCPP
jgi:hypothetical protein